MEFKDEGDYTVDSVDKPDVLQASNSLKE